MNELVLLVPGVILLLAGGVAMAFPPRRVNWWYGYRTPRSMRSQETWDDSNRLAARLILIVGILSVNTGITCMFFSRYLEVAMAIVAVVTGVLSLAILAVVEAFLARMFDREGRPRDRA